MPAGWKAFYTQNSIKIDLSEEDILNDHERDY